jgi:ABC-2 type transport system ATP-binding protein
LRHAPLEVQTVEIAQPTLNDVFLQLTGRAIRDEGADSNERLRSAMRRRRGRI